MILYFYLNDQPYIAKEQFAPQARSTQTHIMYFIKKETKIINPLLLSSINQTWQTRQAKYVCLMTKYYRYMSILNVKMIFPVSTLTTTGCVSKNKHTNIFLMENNIRNFLYHNSQEKLRLILSKGYIYIYIYIFMKSLKVNNTILCTN